MRTGVLCLAAVCLLAAPSVAGAAVWTVPGQFATIQEAVDDDSVLDGDTVVVSPGYHAGAVVTKRLLLRGLRGAVINRHPEGVPLFLDTYTVGFWFPGSGLGSGSRIKGFVFRRIAFPVFSAGADNVRILRNKMKRPIQGVTNWGGSGWLVRRNTIRNLLVDNGGGVGVFIGDWEATPAGVDNNRVIRNRIYGKVVASPEDGGHYWASGVALYADFRWGAPGAVSMANNRVVSNTIALLDTVTPVLVRVAAVEVAEAENPIPDDFVVRDNYINFNKLSGTRVKANVQPFGLTTVNTIQGYIPGATLETLSSLEGGISPFR